MAIFWNIFIKIFSIFITTSIILGIIFIFFYFIGNQNVPDFKLLKGDQSSSNEIAIIELNGLIIEKNQEFPELTNPFIISPSDVNSYLETLSKISPEIIIFSINSPGGTVSASKNLYEIIRKYKKKHNVKILVHTSELLASGGYWASTSADAIYGNYGSIIGSIGVKGPDWFFYNKPKSISTGIFGNKIETKNGIEVYSSSAGKSKDIFNPFRKPTNYELDHLQKMVDQIYNEFVRIVSKERKIEINTIINDIGALIYIPKEAAKLNLIDKEISLDELINETINQEGFKNYKIIKKYNEKKSILREILISNFFEFNSEFKYECIYLRSSISAVLSYQSTGC